MLLVINQTSTGTPIGDSEAEEIVMEFFEWLKNPDEDYDPRDIFGEPYTIPLVKESQDEELDNFMNCNEWQVDVDSSMVIYAARTLVKEGVIPLEHIKIYAEGVDCGLDKTGRLKSWPESLCHFDNFLERLLKQ